MLSYELVTERSLIRTVVDRWTAFLAWSRDGHHPHPAYAPEGWLKRLRALDLEVATVDDVWDAAPGVASMCTIFCRVCGERCARAIRIRDEATPREDPRIADILHAPPPICGTCLKHALSRVEGPVDRAPQAQEAP